MSYWYGEAFAPAGSSTWTTAADLARYAQAVLDGTAPGSAALEPRLRNGADGIGLAWHVRERNGRQITWHNGATGGYRSMLALDRDRHQAVVVLGNTSRSTDQLGLTLAATGPGQTPAATARLRLPAPAALVVPLAGLLGLVTFAWYGLRGRTRLKVADGMLWGVAGLLILLVHGPWGLLPGWIWGALAGVSGVVGVLALRRARRLPTLPRRRRALAVLSPLITAVVIAVVLWTT